MAPGEHWLVLGGNGPPAPRAARRAAVATGSTGERQRLLLARALVLRPRLLRDGRALRQGPVSDVLTADAVSDCYGTTVEVETWHGRWRAVAVGPVPGAYGDGGPGRSLAWTST